MPDLPARTTRGASESGQAAPRRLADVRSWGYQLQNLDIAEAAGSPFDLLVVDHAKDGSDETALRPGEVGRLAAKPDGSQRVVLAYLSIGEAESYRYYWQKSWKRSRPAWLLGENPDWAGNYAVCFWAPEWQRLVCGGADAYLDRIISAGFDGVYLDKCDVYEDLLRRHRREAAGRRDVERDMVTFVAKLSAYAKSKAPEFAIVMQNAEQLLKHAQLRQAIDAVAKEELLFGLDRPEKRNPADEIDEARRHLDRAKAESKPVLVVEYLDNPAKIADAERELSELGYIAYIAPKDRELDRLRWRAPAA